MDPHITRRDGTREKFNADKINKSIERACFGLVDPIAKVTQIATDTRLTVYDGITTEEMDLATINAAVQNIKDDPDFDKVATRLFLKTIYKKVLGPYGNDLSVLNQKHRDFFPQYIEEGIQAGRLDPRMKEKFNLEELARTLDLNRDELFVYAGVTGLINRYALKNPDQDSLETPQYFFMRVAMGLSYNEENPTEWAKKFYNKMSRLEYVAGGSCNLGAGTTRPALSNCFLIEVQDDMEHIAKSVADVMMLSKASGGIGTSLTKLRSAGSPLISAGGGASTGPTPFAKIMDTAIRAIQRGGKKKGALCFYMENWHADFLEFIDWKHNAGDDYMRMRTANTASYLSDEFMKRVNENADWYMFDPKETADLVDLYGNAFSKRYREYIEMADAGKLRIFKKIPARELFRKMIVALQTTSHPWLAWKDSTNARALNNNTGIIPGSNLCMEICLPHNRENIAVCNLASINLANHVSNKEVNWQKLEETTRMAVRFLDNLIDINKLPLPEARKSDQENRAMGLGVMGVADVFEKLGLPYDSEPAYNFVDKVFEFISYMAIDESANLAQERGVYTNFEGSRWSQGMVPIDSIEFLETERGEALSVDKTSHHKGLDWNLLRMKVKQGMRNSTLMAVAPNANIGLLAGTVPGMDARFSQVFARNKISGKYLDINPNLVRDLKNLDLWDDVKELIIERQGDISEIEVIPEHVRNVYKTSFTNSPYAYVEVAARAQKWIDQGISRNIYLETRDVDRTMDLYMTAWKKGLKSTYYLHMKPRHTAEQSTVRVNKAEAMGGRKGFAAISSITPKQVVAEDPIASFPTPETPIESDRVPEPEPMVIEMPAPAPKVEIKVPEPSIMTRAQVEVKEPALVPARRPGFNIHYPENPQDALVCDSCQ